MSNDRAAASFGMIGLGVMGQNLALNIEEHGFPVAVWNYETDWIDTFLTKNAGKKLVGCKTLEEFAAALERPRRVMMMIKAGKPVDTTLEKLKKILSPGDIVIDGGNEWYENTRRRAEEMKAVGIHFFGSGVSGGEEGARHGPSLMPGGDKEAYERVRPVFEAIAAKTDSGPCVTHCGPDGAGHFVKMVHNGIEYGDMQLIAEAYDLMRKGLGLGAEEIAGVFAEWNKGPLESFLIELTAKVFTVKDPKTSKALVDVVLDKAGQKGTGKWTAQVALDLGIAIPTIAAAIDARVISSMKDERVTASKKIRVEALANKPGLEKKAFIAAVHDALLASKICSYAQGMSLIRAASDANKWNANLKEFARIWKGGCIIRARFLDSIMRAFERNPKLPSLLVDDEFLGTMQSTQKGWRTVVSEAMRIGIATPAMSASLAYFDAYRSESLPQNLTQAQRDAFGAHTYQRVDETDGPFVHSEWLKS